MTPLGINKKLRSAILLPEFEDFRYTESAKYWICDAFRSNYDSLQSLNERLRKDIRVREETGRIRKPGYKFTRGLQAPGIPYQNRMSPPPSPAGANDGEYTKGKGKTNNQRGKGNGGTRGESQTKGEGLEGKSKNVEGKGKGKIQGGEAQGKGSNAGAGTSKGKGKIGAGSTPLVAVEPPALTPPSGFTTIWKVLDKKRSLGFIDPVTGELNIWALWSSLWTDFSCYPVTYFTPQKLVADRYAKWAKHKAEIAEIVIIQVDVPFSFSKQRVNSNDFSLLLLNNENPENLWKKLVWHCKQQDKRFPKSLDFVQNFGLLIGHCTTGKEANFQKLTHHSLFNERHILKINEGGSIKLAMQLAIQGRAAENDFNKQCRGHVQVHEIAPLKQAKENSE